MPSVPNQITVHEGDNLATLAERYYGSQRAMFAIVRDNPGIITYDSSGNPTLFLNSNIRLNLPDPEGVDVHGYVSQKEVDTVFGAIDNAIAIYKGGQSSPIPDNTPAPTAPVSTATQTAASIANNPINDLGKPTPLAQAGNIAPRHGNAPTPPKLDMTIPANVAAAAGRTGVITPKPTAFFDPALNVNIEALGPQVQLRPKQTGGQTDYNPFDPIISVGNQGPATLGGSGGGPTTTPKAAQAEQENTISNMQQNLADVAGVVGAISREQLTNAITGRALDSTNPAQSAEVVMRVIELAAITGDRNYLPPIMNDEVFNELGAMFGDVPYDTLLQKLGYASNGDGTVWRLDPGESGMADGPAGNGYLYNAGVRYSAAPQELYYYGDYKGSYGGNGSGYSYSTNRGASQQREFFGVRRAFG